MPLRIQKPGYLAPRPGVYRKKQQPIKVSGIKFRSSLGGWPGVLSVHCPVVVGVEAAWTGQCQGRASKRLGRVLVLRGMFPLAFLALCY